MLKRLKHREINKCAFEFISDLEKYSEHSHAFIKTDKHALIDQKNSRQNNSNHQSRQKMSMTKKSRFNTVR